MGVSDSINEQIVGEGGLVTPEVESFPQTPLFGAAALWAITVSARDITKFI